MHPFINTENYLDFVENCVITRKKVFFSPYNEN